MINYRYDFELYTLNELPINDARLFLNIIAGYSVQRKYCIRNIRRTI